MTQEAYGDSRIEVGRVDISTLTTGNINRPQSQQSSVSNPLRSGRKSRNQSKGKQPRGNLWLYFGDVGEWVVLKFQKLSGFLNS